MRGCAVRAPRLAQRWLQRPPAPLCRPIPHRSLSIIPPTPSAPAPRASRKTSAPGRSAAHTASAPNPASKESLAGAPSDLEQIDSRDDAKFTPAIAQYLRLKDAHPGFLLLFQMGEFYEAFFEDAVRAAELLGIALTRRGKPPVPMSGVPIHNLDHYLEKLIKRGVMVAICDQMEDAKEAKRRKDIVRREVTRLVTPGTLTEERFLQPRRNNFLASLVPAPVHDSLYALAWLDISTGVWQYASTVSQSALAMHLARLSPSELLLPPSLSSEPSLQPLLRGLHLTLYSTPSAPSSASVLSDFHSIRNLPQPVLSAEESMALASLLQYVQTTQRGRAPSLQAPQRFEVSTTMTLDPPARRALELTESYAGDRRASLLAAIDRTLTGPGARLLATRLNAPLLAVQDIHARQAAVAFFVDHQTVAEETRRVLRGCMDVERALQRLALGKGGPRDLAAIGASLSEAAILERLLSAVTAPLSPLLTSDVSALGGLESLASLLSSALVSDPPLSATDGAFIAPSFDSTLDSLRANKSEQSQKLTTLQLRYRKETGVTSLKIRSNTVIGHYVEVSAQSASRLPSDWRHVQTMATQMRYHTAELTEIEAAARSASAGAVEREAELFSMLVSKMLGNTDRLRALAAALASIDVASALAQIAVERNFCRPDVNNSAELYIKGGRHATVEALQSEAGRAAFVPNDLNLTRNAPVWLVTGPNMGGKSTFLRQNALIVILAQIGAYVPAQEARIGIVDALFCRVGAADELAADRSTFMVEMVEAAAILQRATPRSLVIVDELGRGTAARDGLALAWAALEALHATGCRSLFATHYRELAALAPLPNMQCHTTEVKEESGALLFSHRLTPGVARASYGLQVAALAGVPSSVIARARTLLNQLEQRDVDGTSAADEIASELRALNDSASLSGEDMRALILNWRKRLVKPS